MAKPKSETPPERPKLPTLDQVSAGGVVFRVGEGVEVAIISVGEPVRWQLPKGLVGARETPEAAALREVREETGIAAELMELIDRSNTGTSQVAAGGACAITNSSTSTCSNTCRATCATTIGR
jgi:8-oxo-dGTP pyrophosphatase MutT (NUDIX family)